MTRDAEKCAHCGHVEVDHDGYGGMCDGLGFNHAREVCGCMEFVAPSPTSSEPPIGAVLAEALGAERVEMTKATPGSDEALVLGCLCPVMDNGHGRGRGDGSFWINGDCPLHGDAARDALAALPDPDPSTGKIIDLMAALKASLRAHADGAVRSHPDRVDGRPQDEGQS